MTEASLGSSLDLGSDIEVEDTIYPDSKLISSTSELAKELYPNPLALTDYSMGMKGFAKIALNLQILFSAQGSIFYDAESRKNLLKIICSFVGGVLDENKKQCTTLNTKDLSSQTISSQMIPSNVDIAKLNKELATLHTENCKTTLESAQEKFESNLMIATQNAQILSLKEQISHLEDENNNSSLHDDYQNAITSRDEIINHLSQKQNHFRNKIKVQDEIIHQLQDQQNSDKMTIHQLETEKQEIEMKIKSVLAPGCLKSDSNELRNMQKRISELQQTISSLSNICESQANDLCESRELNHRSFELLNEQNLIIDAFDICCTRIENEKKNCLVELSTVKLSSQKTTEQLNNSENERIKQAKLIEEVQNSLNEYFHDTIQSIPDTIRTVLSEGDPLLKQKIRKLKQIVKGQIRFIQKFAETGEFDNVLLDPENKIKRKAIKDTTLIEISRCKSFLKESGLSIPNDEKEGGDIEDKHISFQIAINNVLRKECERNSKDKKLIKQIKDALGLSEYDDMAKILLDKINSADDFLAEAISLLKIKHEKKSYQKILEFLKQSIVLFDECNNKLRKLIRYEGNITDIPLATIECIKKLRKSKNKEIQNMKNGTSELRNELDAQRIQVAEMKNAIENKDAEISNLKIENLNFSSEIEQLKSATELDKTSLKSQNYILSTQLATANTKIEALTNDLIQIQKKIDESQRDFNKRLKSAIQEESFNSTVQMESIRNEMSQNEAKLKEKLHICSKRIQILKAKNKELVESSANTVEKQKEIIDQLSSQNEELTNQIIVIKRDKESEIRSKVEENKSVILSLQSEKRTLKSEISALTSRCQQIETAKDSYYKAQISSIELKLNSANKTAFEEQKELHISFLHKAASILAKIVPRFGELNEDSFIGYLEKVALLLKEYESRLQQMQSRFLRSDTIK